MSAPRVRNGPCPGDDLIPNAAPVFERTHLIPATPESIWPWIVQLGKGRAGWYLPRSVERWLPYRWRASRSIVPELQHLAPGDVVADYGGRKEFLEVVATEPPRVLVYRSKRFGTSFTWALMLHPRGDTTVVHLRFRGGLRSRGIRRWLIIRVGDLFDWWTTALMLRGLAERATSQ